jgi:DivIVA domain-containing protein
VTLTPEQIRARQFEHSRRGYDRTEVDDFLEGVAATIEANHAAYERLAAQLESARSVEANLRATLVAISRAREEILEAARAERATLLEEARRNAELTGGRAEDEAGEIVMHARRAALDVIAEARRDADYLLDVAHTTAEPLTARVNELRAIVRRTENLMRGLASGVLGDLAQAHLMLDEAPTGGASSYGEAPEMQIVFSEQYEDDDACDVVSPLPAAVDRLLTHLREIG